MLTDQFPVDFRYDVDIIKAQTEPSGDRIIEGFAATGDLDLQGDVITPEGLRTGAETLQKSGMLLWNHTDGLRIGEIMKAVAQDGGIWIKAKIKPDEKAPNELKKLADDAWTWVKEGIVSKFSIQGGAKVSTKDFLKGRSPNYLTRMNLIEASLVPLPANPKAQLFSWYVQKSFEGYFHPKETEIRGVFNPLTFTKKGCEGLVKVDDPSLIDEIVEGIQASPTVCITPSLPGGVVEEVSKYESDQLYMKIRFASTWEPGSTQPSIVVKGIVVNSEDSVLGYVPKGVWINEESSMNAEKTLKKGENMEEKPADGGTVKADPACPPGETCDQPPVKAANTFEEEMKSLLTKMGESIKALSDKVCAIEASMKGAEKACGDPKKADPIPDGQAEKAEPAKEEPKPEPSTQAADVYPQIGKALEPLVKRLEDLGKVVDLLHRETAVQKGNSVNSQVIKKDDKPVFSDLILPRYR